MTPTIYLAPIRGITDRVFRNIFPKYFKGIDLAVAPFISSSHGWNNKKSLINDYSLDNYYGLKTIPQILSIDPDDFLRLANTFGEIGYSTINLNLGCPFPMVVNKGRGCGMLPYPPKIDSFLEKIFSKIDIQVSIKLRLGLEYPDEILNLIPIFNNYPIHELIIHPRTGKQMYKGNVNLDAFEECLGISKKEVIYNGDINSLLNYKDLSKRFTSISKWMIGRGVLCNPFLAEEIKNFKDHDSDEKLKIIYEFHNELYKEYSSLLSGPSHITDKMKNIWSYLANYFEDSKKIQKKIKKTQNVKQYSEVVNNLFENELKLNQ